MALKPEVIKRRKRTILPRAPPRTLGAKAPLEADEKLEKLLEELLAEAKKETLFTMTLERDRLFSALLYAGFVTPVWINTELQLAPLATTTVYLAVPPGRVLVPKHQAGYNSLPWWLSVGIWLDTDPPALPTITVVRAPDYYRFDFGGIVPIRRFIRFTVTNNHVANTANFLAMQAFSLMTEASWDMQEAIYLKPIAEYAQEKAEELTGRPFP